MSDHTPDPDPTIDAPWNTSTKESAPGLGAVAGDAVGPFKIIRILGEGGFGVVYLAEQTSPVKRRVALKVIKPGMDTKSVIARFEAERQALAMMDFPGIAQVFEAGATPEGRPYFVMEYVRGEPITSYCDRHRLDTRERLELFARVCDAIQHAHQKGVIHRDLKPGNILVTIDTRTDPQPKVIDFGIAKATAQSLTEKTLFTEQGQLIGTPEYMSPEQAEMSAADVDTRSDVYSLGVVLYELLSGQLPFDPKTLRSKGFAEIQRIIREENPPKPSTKLTTTESDEGTRIAEARKTKLAELQSTLRRELEWIPLKALRKERTERYSSAEDLADDVRRYLVGEPLEAGPESASYRFKKLVRRNKGPFIAVGLIALTLIGGIIGTTIFAVRAAEQATIAAKNAVEADRQRANAEKRADELEEVSNFQSNQLGEIDVPAMGWSLRGKMLEELDLSPSDVKKADFTGAALALLNEYVFDETYAAINEQFADQPLVRAQLLQSLSSTLIQLGQSKKAKMPQETALRLRREHLGNEHRDTLSSIHNMGYLLKELGDRDESMAYYTESLETNRRVRDEADPATLKSMHTMSTLLAAQANFEKAMEYATEALEICRRELPADDPLTLTSIQNMGSVLYVLEKFDEAELYLAEALEVRRRRDGDEHPDTLNSFHNMALTLTERRKFEKATEYMAVALEGRRRILSNDHPLTLRSIGGMGYVLQAQEKYEEALPYLAEALENSRRVLGDDHPDTLNSINNMAFVLTALGRLDEAAAYYTEAIQGRRDVLPDDHHWTVISIRNMGFLLARQKKYDEAEPYFVDALEANRRALPEGHEDTLESIKSMGWFFQQQRRYDEAKPYFAEALEIRRRLHGDDKRKTIEAFVSLSVLYFFQGSYGEAEPHLLKALEGYRRLDGERASTTLEKIRNLILLYDTWHKAEPDGDHDAKAAEYRALLEELTKSQ